MSVAAVSPSLELSRIDRRELARWGVAALLIVAFHIAVAYALQVLRSTEEDGGPPPALMIELAPVAFAPPMREQAAFAEEVPSEIVEPIEETEEVERTPPESIVPETAERAETEKPQPVPAEAVTEAAEETVAEKVQETVAEKVEQEKVADAPEKPAETPPVEQLAPEVAETVMPEVALPIPQPRPVESVTELAEPVKPVEREIVKEVEPAKPAPAKEKQESPKKKLAKKTEKAKEAPDKEKAPPKKKASEAATVSNSEARPARKATAPKKSESTAASRGNVDKWKSKVFAWLKRHQRYPRGPEARGEEGKVTVAFSIDGSGRVLSARVARSSGNDELDRAAIDMVRRSSPVPAPPSGAGTSITVPVVFK